MLNQPSHSNKSSTSDASTFVPETQPLTMSAKEFREAEKSAPSAATGWRFNAAFCCLCIVNLVCALDATSLSVALPTMADKLHGSGIEAFWAGTSFLLTATVFQPSFASLSNAFGRKPMLLMALSFFTIGSIIGAVAKNFTDLLVGRSLQGVGGGGISALTNVIITDMVPLADRGKWLGLITMQWAIGSVTGPIIGGVLAEKASWRWIFWINIPFCVLGFVMIPLFLKLQYKPGNLMEKLKQIDWVGSFLFVASTTSFLIPITWGGIMYPWNHWRTLVPLLVGLGGLVFFMLWSRLVPSQPILRGSLFKTATGLVCYFSIVIHGMFLWSVLYYMPLYFEAAKNYTPIQSGIALFPWTFTTAPAAVIVGILIARIGSYRWAIYGGWFLTTLGVGLMILFEASTPMKMWVPLSLVSGVGLGMLYPAMSLCNQASATPADTTAAAALNPFFRNYGQMLGVAVGGSIVQNMVKKKLEAIPSLAPKAAAYSKDASALVEVIRAMTAPAQRPLRDQLTTAYCDSLRTLWIVMCGLAGGALVLSVLFTKSYSLQQAHETEQGFVGSGGAKAASVDEEKAEPRSGAVTPDEVEPLQLQQGTPRVMSPDEEQEERLSYQAPEGARSYRGRGV
ncbi:uncharacterized protein K452DRAFT_160324 [Aplosporella prunicola CBS 121167]|uniref:Major facilitator superfamily (MFS) profile domain-containing protein n=1 Tax=Aplosporella prunicola CBS 121167 TaxID=1176127 RepID=A0A6A6BHK3_9PEZI|nr:uncharacterized protein K452DRAFT_160324 [Aplosporella prunicola CBS 121167]KAF2143629.1 hypothetical protein K452DRAFT_160324 [Aplosporella prunicola CBS 121167]